MGVERLLTTLKRSFSIDKDARAIFCAVALRMSSASPDFGGYQNALQQVVIVRKEPTSFVRLQLCYRGDVYCH